MNTLTKYEHINVGDFEQDMFEGTEEQQIERQMKRMREATYFDGSPVYKEGTVFAAFVRNQETQVIHHRLVTL